MFGPPMAFTTEGLVCFRSHYPPCSPGVRDLAGEDPLHYSYEGIVLLGCDSAMPPCFNDQRDAQLAYWVTS